MLNIWFEVTVNSKIASVILINEKKMINLWNYKEVFLTAFA